MEKESDLRVVLAGPVGAGKTTIAQCLAKRMRLTHVGLDQWRISQTPPVTATFFDVRGVMAAILSSERRVLLDVGGDTIFREFHRVNNDDRASRLTEVKEQWRAVVVLLAVSETQHRTRFLSTKDRTPDEFPAVGEAWTFARRWWTSVADVVLDVTDLTPDGAAALISRMVKGLDDRPERPTTDAGF